MMKNLTLPELVSEFQSVKERIEADISAIYPKGKRLLWKDYKYTGRMCEILSVFWEMNYKKELVINIRVKTMNKKGDGFINSNDLFHRTYWELGAFDEV